MLGSRKLKLIIMVFFTEKELENEIWKDVPGYEGLYQVSDLGQVKSLNYNKIKKEKILKQSTSGIYSHIILHKKSKKKTQKVHQLVAIAFLNHVPCGLKMQVNHKDKNTKNNKLWNLEILNIEEHTKHTHPNKSSQYTGVTFIKKTSKWMAQPIIYGKRKNLGLFSTEIEAVEAILKAKELVEKGDFSLIKPKEYSSKYTGVCWAKHANKWQSYIKVNGKTISLGFFTNELEAYNMRKKTECMVKENDFSFMKSKKSSQYKGVYLNKKNNKWQSEVNINGKRTYLGAFCTEHEAYEAVQKASKESIK
jgi:hypothetical protein